MIFQNISRATAMPTMFRVFTAAILLLPVMGCDYTKNQLKSDREGGMEMQDYRDAFAPRLPDVDDKFDSASIPELQPYIASSSATMKSMPLVSISLNQSIPLRDALFELARQANYDIELDPSITGAIIFTARERPFDQVIKRISDAAGLRYSFDDEVLRVEVDTHYSKVYKIDYLSFVRSNSGSIRNDIAVVSGEGADTGSKFSASSESEADFWGELEVNLAQILEAGTSTSLRTKSNPRIMATEQNPDVAAVAPAGANGNVSVQPPEAVLHVEVLPLDDNRSSNSSGDEIEASFSVNKHAGMISVFATERLHKEIAEYLSILKRSVTAQVLIEAKILEVTLSDEFASGIDWRMMNPLNGEAALNFLSTGFGALDTLGPATSRTPLNVSDSANSTFVVGFAGSDVQSMVEMVSSFGTVKALASPRLTVINNQSAVMNVATNNVFFEIDIESSSDGVTNTVTVDSEIRNVPEGVLVNVQPSINLEDGTISMSVRPTITRITGTVPDPGVAFAAAMAGVGGAITSNIPELNVQEVDSVIQINSGQAVVMGGLLQDRIDMHEDGIPGLSEIPLFGSLFKQHDDGISKTELVIFLKATILDSPSESVHDTDRDFYRRFSGDRRPLKL